MKNMIPIAREEGIALVEALIAILIFSLGILAIVGLQAATLKHTTDAKYRVDASFLANQALGEMWAHRKSIASFAVKDEAVPSLPGGKRTVTVDGNSVTVTISWQLPGQPAPHSHVVTAMING
jgi:type IV pilus assembly protein PilV